MFEEFIPLITLGVVGIIGVAGGNVYLNHIRESRKAAARAVAQQNTPEAGLDQFFEDLMQAPKIYPEYANKIAAIKAKNPNADLSGEEMEVKMMKWAYDHQTLVRLLVPIAKPIIARKIKGLQRSL